MTFPSIVLLKQLPIDDDSKARLLKVRTDMFFDTVNDMAEKLYTGDITIGQWQERMKAEIRQLHTSTGAIGKGGWGEMTSQDWGRLGPRLKAEYKWLGRFADYVSENRDTISLQYIQNRARLYGHGAAHSAVVIEAPLYIADLLPWLPKDGSTKCLNKCKCKWSLTVTGTEGLWQLVSAVWTLSPAEHCETCIGRDGHTEYLRIPPDVTVPPQLGGY